MRSLAKVSLHAVTLVMMLSCSSTRTSDPRQITENTWNGYRHFFISPDGRVKRPKNGDTVSEGQAYAMLRAVWMDDKAAFDSCYRWTEKNLSRKRTTGDNLLAWHWKDDRVTDWMPASDADVDYALSLIFADARWPRQAASGLEDYGTKAHAVLNDILTHETFRTHSGRLYLAPWILDLDKSRETFPQNPSYYSPAHFRIFHAYSGDPGWLELADTTYYLMNSLSRSFAGSPGVGLVPDWCAVDLTDAFFPLEGRNSGFGWEAVRVPIRLAMDAVWFERKEGEEALSNLAGFAERQWEKDGSVFCEYGYDGTATKRYESPAFYAAYYCAALVSGSPLTQDFADKNRSYTRQHGKNWIYQDQNDYYVNSLAWFVDGFRSGVIQCLAK